MRRLCRRRLSDRYPVILRRMVVVLAVAGCVDEGPSREAETPGPGATCRQKFEAPAPTKVDVLVVVGGAASMAPRQQLLIERLRTLVLELESGSADYRVAVVSTDRARQGGNLGKFLVQPGPSEAEGCEGAESPAVLRNGQLGNTDDLERSLRCQLRIGTSDQADEAGLEVMRQALSCEGPNRERFGPCCVEGVYQPTCVVEAGDTEPEFLRPDAALIVVILSDTDDCSGPSDEITGCGRPERLTPVAEYTALLNGLKVMPSQQLLIAAIVGEERFTEAGNLMRYSPGETGADPRCVPGTDAFDPALAQSETCCPNGRCVGPLQPACQDAGGAAFTGHRYLALSRSLDLGGLESSLCDQDRGDVFEGLFTRGASLVSLLCLDEAPACRLPTGRPCVTDADREDLARYSVSVQRECSRVACLQIQPPWSLDAEDVRLVKDPVCGSGLGVQFRRQIKPGETVCLDY